MFCDEITVIIHGFGGTTAEIIYLKEYLDEKGLNTDTVTLAGHVGTKKDLHKTTHCDWLDSAAARLEKIKHDKINIIGFSMGGLIGVNLCETFKINKLVLVNTPIYFWNLKIIAKKIISDLRSGGRENINYFRKSVGRVSLKSGIEFLRILTKSKKLIKNVNYRSLILQCADDETVHQKSAKYLKDRLGETALLSYHKGGCHQVFTTDGELRDAFCDEIYQFIKSP